MVKLNEAGEDQYRRAYARRAQAPQYFVPVDVGKHQIEENDVIIIELADLQAILAEIGRVANEVFLAKHHLDAGCGCRIILDKKHAHKSLRVRPVARTGGAFVNQDYRQQLTTRYQRSWTRTGHSARISVPPKPLTRGRGADRGNAHTVRS